MHSRRWSTSWSKSRVAHQLILPQDFTKHPGGPGPEELSVPSLSSSTFWPSPNSAPVRPRPSSSVPSWSSPASSITSSSLVSITVPTPSGAGSPPSVSSAVSLPSPSSKCCYRTAHSLLHVCSVVTREVFSSTPPPFAYIFSIPSFSYGYRCSVSSISLDLHPMYTVLCMKQITDTMVPALHRSSRVVLYFFLSDH